MASILDTAPYPFHERDARELLVLLSQLHPTPAGALLLAKMAGLDTGFILTDQPPVLLWKSILELAATSGLTRALTQLAHDRLAHAAPARAFLARVLAGQPAVADSEPRADDGAPKFVSKTDDVFDHEALLYHDSLMLDVGQLPGLIRTLGLLVALAPSVCKLSVAINGLGKAGTAVRVGPDLLLTNWHVLHDVPSGARATAATAEFGYEFDADGQALAATNVNCDVASILADRADDWAVVRTAAAIDGRWPAIPLADAVAPEVGAAAYIIQHPIGERKRVGFVRNTIVAFDDRVAHYLTDTQEGSSGAPVFDGAGRLIALHHAGGRPQVVVGKPPVKKNEGIRISRILAGLAAKGFGV